MPMSPTTWHAWPALADMYGLRALTDDECRDNGLTLSGDKTPTCAYVWSEQQNSIGLFKRASDEAAALEYIAAILGAEAGLYLPEVFARPVPQHLLDDSDWDRVRNAFVVSPIRGQSPAILSKKDRDLDPDTREELGRHISAMLPFAVYTTNEDYNNMNIVITETDAAKPYIYAIDFEEMALHKPNDGFAETMIINTAFSTMSYYKIPFYFDAARATVQAIQAIPESTLFADMLHVHRVFPRTLGKKPRTPLPHDLVKRLKTNADNLNTWIDRESLQVTAKNLQVQMIPG